MYIQTSESIHPLISLPKNAKFQSNCEETLYKTKLIDVGNQSPGWSLFIFDSQYPHPCIVSGTEKNWSLFWKCYDFWESWKTFWLLFFLIWNKLAVSQNGRSFNPYNSTVHFPHTHDEEMRNPANSHWLCIFCVLFLSQSSR